MIDLGNNFRVKNPYEASVLVKRDNGHTKICPRCNKRYGGPVFGPRPIDIVVCPDHTKAARDADLERLLQSRRAVDPPKEKSNYIRKPEKKRKKPGPKPKKIVQTQPQDDIVTETNPPLIPPDNIVIEKSTLA